MLPQSHIAYALIHDTGLILLSMILGGIIGMERGRSDHPAGLRTHIIVCVGAALLTAVDRSIPNAGGRIAAQIVTGIGFLGAGTILREANGSLVRGLTTAATIWTTAGIGIAVGTGGIYAELGAIVTFLVFLTLSQLDKLEQFLNRSRVQQELTFVIATDDNPLQRMGDALNSLHDLGIHTGQFNFQTVQGGQVVHVTLRLPSPAVRAQVKPVLEANPNIIHVEWGPGT